MKTGLRFSEMSEMKFPSPATESAPKRPRLAAAAEAPTAESPITHQTSSSSTVSKSSSLADLTDHATLHSMPLTIVIFGVTAAGLEPTTCSLHTGDLTFQPHCGQATGDLAKKKLFPALYQLCMQGHLPCDLNVRVPRGLERCACATRTHRTRRCARAVMAEVARAVAERAEGRRWR